MVAASGGELLDAAGRATFGELFGVATLVTPNIPEAEVLWGRPIGDLTAMAAAAKALGERGAGAVLVKGGHLDGEEAIDLLWSGGTLREYRAPRVPSKNTHGTGCTLSAAITALLAWGLPLEEAVGRAKRYVSRGITAAAGWQIGHGPGPLDHGLAKRPGDAE